MAQIFGEVRLHTGSEAARLNRAISAQAFTYGPDIYLGEGKNDLELSAGKQLLAHELTHTIQQGVAGTNGLAAQRKQLSDADGGLIQRDGDDATPGGDFIGPPTLHQMYNAAVQSAKQTGNFQDAAEKLNGFNREDILSRLAQLTPDEVGYLHLGALGNPRVGPDSQVAQMTKPGTPSASTLPPAATKAPAAPLKDSKFQDWLTKNPELAKAYTPIHGLTGRLIGYSRSSAGYSEVRNTDGEIVWSDEIPLEHGLPIIDPVLDLVEKGLRQLGYVAVGTIDTVLENNWRALGLPVDKDHTQPIAKKLGIPLDATAYTIGRGAGHALSLLQVAAEMVGGATLFLSGLGEFMAGVATTPEGIGVVIASVGVVTMAGGATVVIYGGALGKATFFNMKTMKGEGGGGGREFEPWLLSEGANNPEEIMFFIQGQDSILRKYGVVAAARISQHNNGPLLYASSIDDPDVKQFAGDMLKRNCPGCLDGSGEA